MKKASLNLWLTRLAWGLLGFDLLVVFSVPTDTYFDSSVLLFTYTGWLTLSLVAASTWLVIHYRTFFRTWSGWAISVACLILCSMIFQGVLPIRHPNFSLFLIVSGWLVGVATAILLWYHGIDTGLRLIGWMTVIFIWSLALFSRFFPGNIVEFLMLDFTYAEEPSPLWWLQPIICVIGWVVPLGILGFLGHAVRLIVREFK
ncbi:MAG: hypothetical protein GY832_17035 [Chloroflexi bacterium]|nr:hypothetical protein [Chloroflexota bacterium]